MSTKILRSHALSHACITMAMDKNWKVAESSYGIRLISKMKTKGSGNFEISEELVREAYEQKVTSERFPLKHLSII